MTSDPPPQFTPLRTPRRPGLPPSPGLTPKDRPQALYRPPEELDRDYDAEYFAPLDVERLRAISAVSAGEDNLEASDEESTLSADVADEDADAPGLRREDDNVDGPDLVPENESDSENEEEAGRFPEPPEEQEVPAADHPHLQPRDAEPNPDFDEDMEDVLGGKIVLGSPAPLYLCLIAIGMRGPLRILGQHVKFSDGTICP